MVRATPILVAGMLLGGVESASACYAIAGHPAAWVREADSIVRVRALEAVPAHEATAASGSRTLVTFEILEVLKGDTLFALSVTGTISGRSDFNDRPVPYGMVRPGGRGGGCFAQTYQAGGEYLLLLRKREGELTPYWAPLGATNEQLRGSDDLWLTWVRGELAARAPSPRRQLDLGRDDIAGAALRCLTQSG
jgi:hypothetical protein